MDNTCIGILVFLVAMVTSMAVFPWALMFARRHGIVDNPNARKLQRVPVPVFGGIVVYSGVLMGGLVLSLFMWSWVVVYGLIGMTIMMMILTTSKMISRTRISPKKADRYREEKRHYRGNCKASRIP